MLWHALLLRLSPGSSIIMARRNIIIERRKILPALTQALTQEWVVDQYQHNERQRSPFEVESHVDPVNAEKEESAMCELWKWLCTQPLEPEDEHKGRTPADTVSNVSCTVYDVTKCSIVPNLRE
jgi:hypothetical protein